MMTVFKQSQGQKPHELHLKERKMIENLLLGIFKLSVKVHSNKREDRETETLIL